MRTNFEMDVGLNLKKMIWILIASCLLIELSDATCNLNHVTCNITIGSLPNFVEYDCTSPIYCRGELLKTLQLAELFNDSKTFVDLYQLNDPDVTLSNFAKFMRDNNNSPTKDQCQVFLDENFSQESELDVYIPPEWQPNPPALLRIKDDKFRKWALDLNEIWKTLLRTIKPEVCLHPERHSIICVYCPFIVPGGRFKEFYYWDSYWAMTGMLLSGLHDTVRGILENFFHVVCTYGFIPNGGRLYYLMRSHPPLLIRMTDKYLEFTKDIQFLVDNIGTLEREFDFWLRTKMIEVQKDGKTYNLARYVVRSQGPRPESYKEDYEVGQQVDPNRLDQLYNDLKAAAESGWDFSSRWFDNTDGKPGNLSTIATSSIIPVELNAFLQENARILGEYNLRLNRPVKAQYYAKIAKEFQDAIDNVLWNEEEGVWLDYDTVKKEPRNQFYPTNLSPLYTSSYNKSDAEKLAVSAVLYLEKNGIFDYMGGTPASNVNTGEQWDFPNAWAPLQSFVILGLRGTGYEPATSMARTLVTRWLRANYIGFTEYKEMFEKYDAVNPGQYGGGGEYKVQPGFGWTNGAALEFLDIYSSSVRSDDSSSNSEPER